MSVTATGWVDPAGFYPNPGQFPIAVESHLNRFVADHVPGVTTVTNATRYYALHGLIAAHASAHDLDTAATIDVLRRTEVLLAYVCHVHASTPQHAPDAPAAHGADVITRHASAGDLDVAKLAATGPGSYSEARWGFAGPYRGSELTLKILDQTKFAPGEWYDNTAARSVLQPVLDTAKHARVVSADQAAQLASACLCTTPQSPDGAWLARLLAGDQTADPERPTFGGILAQLGRLVAVTITNADITSPRELNDEIMFGGDLLDDDRLARMVAPHRWRGALLRAESVHAWRRIWKHLSDLVDGATPVTDLVEKFADLMPDGTVRSFRDQLPPTRGPDGNPRAAERELAGSSDVHDWLGTVFLGAQRLTELTGEELRGFRARDEDLGALSQELSPGWAAALIDRCADQPVKDFGHDLAEILIHRSQRVALRKARFDPKTLRFSYPARMHVRDGIAVRRFGETAPQPATRLPQYLSITRQAGLLTFDDDGNVRLGPHGGLLG